MRLTNEQLKIFGSLPEEIIEKLFQCSQMRSIAAGDFLIRENEAATTFFMIEEGELQILKDQIQLGAVRKGDVLGESSINGGVRNASAKALGPVKVIEVSVPALAKELTPAQFAVLKNVIFEREMDKLSKLNQVATLSIKQNFEDMKAKANMGRFIVYVLTLIFIYIFVIQTVTVLKLNIVSSSVISIPILLIMGAGMYFMMKQSGHPMSAYGFTLKGGTKALVESSLFTLPILVALVILKWIFIHYISAFSSLTLFHISPALSPGAPPVSNLEAFVLVLAYTIFVPVQEIIFRGAMQSSLQLFLTGKNRFLLAILISNIPFCMIHFHLSLILVLLTYLFGSFWGWMLARQKTLVGPCFSHFVVGLFAFFILGIQDILVF